MLTPYTRDFGFFIRSRMGTKCASIVGNLAKLQIKNSIDIQATGFSNASDVLIRQTMQLMYQSDSK